MLVKDLPKNNSILIGKLWIKPSSYEEYIASCVRPVIIENPDDAQLQGFTSLNGSSTLIKINDVSIICMTRHQTVANLPLSKAMDSVRIGSNRKGRFENITFDSIISTDSCAGEEFNDIIFATVNKCDNLYFSEIPYFFPLKKLDQNHSNAKFVFVGYPKGLSTNHMDSTWRSKKYELVTLVKDCKLDREFTTDVSHFNRYTYDKYDNVCLDGMSGGAVFGLLPTSGGFEAFLSGIITRAGNGSIYTINANHLLSISTALDFNPSSKTKP